jgi:hypothetical protein
MNICSNLGCCSQRTKKVLLVSKRVDSGPVRSIVKTSLCNECCFWWFHRGYRSMVLTEKGCDAKVTDMVPDPMRVQAVDFKALEYRGFVTPCLTLKKRK